MSWLKVSIKSSIIKDIDESIDIEEEDDPIQTIIDNDQEMELWDSTLMDGLEDEEEDWEEEDEDLEPTVFEKEFGTETHLTPTIPEPITPPEEITQPEIEEEFIGWEDPYSSYDEHNIIFDIPIIAEAKKRLRKLNINEQFACASSNRLADIYQIDWIVMECSWP